MQIPLALQERFDVVPVIALGIGVHLNPSIPTAAVEAFRRNTLAMTSPLEEPIGYAMEA